MKPYHSLPSAFHYHQQCQNLQDSLSASKAPFQFKHKLLTISSCTVLFEFVFLSTSRVALSSDRNYFPPGNITKDLASVLPSAPSIKYARQNTPFSRTARFIDRQLFACHLLRSFEYLPPLSSSSTLSWILSIIN